MSQVDAHVHDARASQSADSAPRATEEIEAERYWSIAEYAQALGKTPRWVRDHCNARYGDLVHSRVGDELKFSAEDRAENKRRMAVRPPERERHERPAGLQLPTDPVQLARLLDDVRRVSA